MATLELNVHSNLTASVEVRESDKYSGLAYMKITKTYREGDAKSSGEMFLTPTQLENLGRFLIRQAEEIKQTQLSRESA